MLPTRSYTRTFGSLVRQADPTFNIDRRKVLAYEFYDRHGHIARRDYLDPNTTGPYETGTSIQVGNQSGAILLAESGEDVSVHHYWYDASGQLLEMRDHTIVSEDGSDIETE